MDDKENTLERAASVFRALGNPVRLQILTYLIHHPGCITGEIVDVLPIAQSTTSQHLNVLKQAGIIQGTTEGPATCYCLSESVAETVRASVGVLFGESEDWRANRSE